MRPVASGITGRSFLQVAFFCFALSAFFRLLRIMTTERKLPTTVVPRMRRMTGRRIAQTRGRKKECRIWSSSTKGWMGVSWVGVRKWWDLGCEGYHEQCPHGVVDEDGGCCDEHAEANETVLLAKRQCVFSVECVGNSVPL
jgi:hypothetical protein